jgi:hypothetical protein
MRTIALAGLWVMLATPARAQEQECAECDEVPPPQVAPTPPPPGVPPPPTMYVSPDGQVLASPLDAPPPYPSPYPLGDPLRPKTRSDLLLRGAIGGAYRRALDRDFGGGTLDVEIGWDGRWVSVGGRFGLESGATQSHLAYQHLQWGVGVDAKFGDRVRIGIAPYVGALIISRASNGDGSEPLLGVTFSLLGECVIAILGPGQPSKRTHPGLDLVVRGGYELVDAVPRSSTLANGASIQLGLGAHY